MASSSPVSVAVIGGYFSANKGGAAMTQAVIDRLPERLGPCRFSVLTLYARGDRELGVPDEVELVSWKPADLLVALPFALLAAVARVLRIPPRLFARTAGLRALAKADVVVDVAGISFVDGRGVPILGYNVLLTGIPLLMGCRVVKMSQAMGPFEGRLNRIAAALVLRRLAAVCPRGAQTEAHLADLGGTNARPAADLAFILRTTPDAEAAAKAILERVPGTGPILVACPSAVVNGYCTAKGIDYPATMAALLQSAVDDLGLRVLIVPHSTHPSDKAGRMHDLPICEDVHARTARESATLLTERPPTQVLRAVVEGADLLVVSRFHAMISGLATSTPTLVVGWSHKYAEVLGAFGLEHWAVDYGELNPESLRARLRELQAGAGAITEQLRTNLPAVEAASLRNLDAVAEVVGAGGSAE